MPITPIVIGDTGQQFKDKLDNNFTFIQTEIDAVESSATAEVTARETHEDDVTAHKTAGEQAKLNALSSNPNADYAASTHEHPPQEINAGIPNEGKFFAVGADGMMTTVPAPGGGGAVDTVDGIAPVAGNVVLESAALTTTDKTYKGAINELDSEIGTLQTSMGTAQTSISTMQTDIDALEAAGAGGHEIIDSADTVLPTRPALKFVGLTVTDDATNDLTLVTAIAGGAGGHVIVDGVGTAMPARAELQFAGMNVTDDLANDKTLVEVSVNADAGVRSEVGYQALTAWSEDAVIADDGVWLRCDGGSADGAAYPGIMGLIGVAVESVTTIVPVMTSDILPSPNVASASSEYSTDLAWRAFDNASGTQWRTATSLITNQFIQIRLAVATMVSVLGIRASAAVTAAPKEFIFQGSNDGTTYLNLVSRASETAWVSGVLRTYTIAVDKQAPYLYYRLVIVSGNGQTYLAIADILLGQETVVVLPNVAPVGGQYTYIKVKQGNYGATGQLVPPQDGKMYVAQDTAWVELPAPPPPPTSSGHIIIDNTGTPMPERSGLQFAGMNVADDLANDKTLVEVAVETNAGVRSEVGMQAVTGWTEPVKIADDGTWLEMNGQDFDETVYPELVGTTSVDFVAVPVHPEMTSNVLPSPYVTSAKQTLGGSYAAYYAFDNLPIATAGYWNSALVSGSTWLDIDLGAAAYADGAKLTPYSGYNPTAFEFQGSLDGLIYVPITTYTGFVWAAAGAEMDFQFPSRQLYRFYRLYVTAHTGSSVTARNLVFYRANYIIRNVPLVNGQSTYVLAKHGNYSADGMLMPPQDGQTYAAQNTAWVLLPEPSPDGAFEYMFEGTALPPTGSEVRLDNLDPALATKVWIWNTTVNGKDAHSALMLIQEHARIRLQEKDNHANFYTFRATGGAVDMGTYVEVPVINTEVSGVVPEQRVLFGFMSGAPEVTASMEPGIDWQLRETPSQSFASVAYGNGLLIAGSNNTGAISRDGGNTWASINLGTCVAYGNGVFVGVSSGTTSFTTKDGKIITAGGVTGGAASYDWEFLKYCGNRFIGVRKSGTTQRSIHVSRDGVTWTNGPAYNVSYTDVTYGNGLYVVSTMDSSGRVWIATEATVDTALWDSNTLSKGYWRSITFGAGTFVMTTGTDTGSGQVATSPNGTTWTLRATPLPLGTWLASTYGNGMFVIASGFTGTQRVMTSPDGVAWTLRTTPDTLMAIADITHADNVFVAVGTYNGAPHHVMVSGYLEETLSVDGVTADYAGNIQLGNSTLKTTNKTYLGALNELYDKSSGLRMDLSAQCNGALLAFALTGKIGTTFVVYLNGQALHTSQYAYDGNVTLTLTTTAPATGDKLWVDYGTASTVTPDTTRVSAMLAWKDALGSHTPLATEMWTGAMNSTRKIWGKIIKIPTLPNATTALHPHGIVNLQRVVRLDGIYTIPSSNTVLCINVYNPATPANSHLTDVLSDNIVIVTAVDRSAFDDNYVYIEYTCTDR